MGTRSLTRIIPRQEGLAYDVAHKRAELALVNIYQQYDGFPSYMAVEYANFLKGLSVGNGISGNDVLGEFANGPGCLAAQLIQRFKTRAGGLYLSPIDNDEGWVDYIYTLLPKEGHETYMTIYDTREEKVIFVGKPEAALKKYDEEQ